MLSSHLIGIFQLGSWLVMLPLKEIVEKKRGWGEASKRNHLPFFFRNRLVSSGVYYHLSNSILLRYHRPGWRLIAPEATGEEESNCFYLHTAGVLQTGFGAEKSEMICFTYVMHVRSVIQREKYSLVVKIGSLTHICWQTICRAEKSSCDILQKPNLHVSQPDIHNQPITNQEKHWSCSCK